MLEKRNLKNLRKLRDGHRKFVQKTVEDAKGLITEGNLIEVKRLKFLRTALETKYSELQLLDREIVDLVDDVKVIDTKVSESCENLFWKLKKGRVRARNSLLWCNLFHPKARERLKVTFRKFSLMQSYPRSSSRNSTKIPSIGILSWESF